MSRPTNLFRRLGAVLALAAAVGTVAVPTAGANHQDVGVTIALEEIRGTAGAPDAVDRFLRGRLQQTEDAACDVVCRYNHNHTLGGNGGGLSLTTDTLGGNGGPASAATRSTSASGWPAPAVGAALSGTILALVTASLLLLRRHRSMAAGASTP
jgi:hypothetical protein